MTSPTLEMPAAEALQTPTPAEMDRARLYLEQTRSEIVGATKSLSDSQWTFTPDPGRWSIAQILEHVIWVQELVLGPLREQLERAPVMPPHPDYALIDDIVIFRIPNRLVKFPTPTNPPGDLSRSQALGRLLANYTKLVEHLETTPGLRNRSVESAPIKAVSNGKYEAWDGYQWIIAAAAHTERHTKQVLEVIADPRFPA
jgi:DinB superfamily